MRAFFVEFRRFAVAQRKMLWRNAAFSEKSASLRAEHGNVRSVVKLKSPLWPQELFC